MTQARAGGPSSAPPLSTGGVVVLGDRDGSPAAPRPRREGVGGPADRALASRAAARRGLVTLDDLADAGVSRRMITRRVQAGRLHRIHPGVYAVGHPGLDAPALHLAATLAAPGSVLTGASGGAAWDLGPWPDVVVLRAPSTRVLQGVHVRRSRRPVAMTLRHGIPTAPITDVLLDLAETAGEWATTRALNEALFRRRTTVALMAAAVAGADGRHGVALLRRMLPLAEALHSVLEDDFFRILAAARLKRPQTNRRVAGHLVDFWWPQERVVVETDGWAAHSTPLRFEGDRRRDADLLAAGVRVMRVTRRQLLDESHAVVARLGAVLLAGPRS